MQVREAVKKRRSIRKFLQKKIPQAILRDLIAAARLAPSAANRQFLEYLVITDPRRCSSLFGYLHWAGYTAPRGTPGAGEEPTAYIVLLINTKKASVFDLRDVGAAAENIMLLAQGRGIATCWLGAIDRVGIRKALRVPPEYKIDTVIALGYPKMVSRVARFKGSIKYYLDQRDVLHVPKRPLEDLLHINKVKDR